MLYMSNTPKMVAVVIIFIIALDSGQKETLFPLFELTWMKHYIAGDCCACAAYISRAKVQAFVWWSFVSQIWIGCDEFHLIGGGIDKWVTIQEEQRSTTSSTEQVEKSSVMDGVVLKLSEIDIFMNCYKLRVKKSVFQWVVSLV